MSDTPRKTVVVPFFPGFYQGPLDKAMDTAVDRLVTTRGWTVDEIYRKAYFSTARDAVTRAWLRVFNEATGLSLELEALDSPKEYNHTTDRIFAYISDKDIKRLETNRTLYPASFEEALRSMFTGYDGFIPFYSNDPQDVEWQTPVQTWDHNQLQALLRAFVISVVPEDEDGLERYLTEAEEEFEDLAEEAIALEIEGHLCEH